MNQGQPLRMAWRGRTGPLQTLGGGLRKQLGFTVYVMCAHSPGKAHPLVNWQLWGNVRTHTSLCILEQERYGVKLLHNTHTALP
jgi:hypothetical protein